MKKRLLLVSGVCLLLCLFFCCSCTAGGEDFGLAPQRTEDGTLRFLFGDEVLATIDLNAIKALPAKNKNMTVQTTSQGTLKEEFTGAQLSDVIKLFDPEALTKYTTLTAYGADGYFSRLKMSEVLEYSNVYIVYLNHGEPLERLDGEDGSLKIVVTADTYGQRFTNYLVDIVFE